MAMLLILFINDLSEYDIHVVLAYPLYLLDTLDIYLIASRNPR